MFNQRGLCHSLVYMKQENNAHITNQCHYKHIRLSLTIIFCFWEMGKNTLYALHLYLRSWKNDFIISHIFYLTTGKKTPKKAFLRNILNLVGFKIIAIKCYVHLLISSICNVQFRLKYLLPRKPMKLISKEDIVGR